MPPSLLCLVTAASCPVFRLQPSKHGTQKAETERNTELINIPAFYSGDVQFEFG
jgi:hypothetical protein